MRPKLSRLVGFTVLVLVAIAPGAAERQEAPRRSSPYAARENGPPGDPSYFPIAVWLQQPSNAARYKEAGINLYVGLWKGPTEQQLAALKAAGMQVVCDQNEVGLAHVAANPDDRTIVGWMHGDEPDNAQPKYDLRTGERDGWGPPVAPAKVFEEYQRMRAADPTRPVFLNLGQGVANDEWRGRGPEGKLEDYPEYVKAADVVSFDVYPVAGIDKPDGENYLWYVAKGVGRLVDWTGGGKPVWNCVECTRIGSQKKATPAQVKAEVWMALVHGSRGLIYFVHEWEPRFNEHALLDDAEMLAAVTAINRQVHELAPVLNGPELRDAATAESRDPDVPVALTTRRGDDGSTYVFAVAMRNAPTAATFTVAGLPDRATAEVIGENRSIAVEGGRFRDDFDPYAVHLYRIRGGGDVD